MAVVAFTWMPVLPFGLRIACIGVFFFMIGDYSKIFITRFEGRRWKSLTVGIVLLAAEYVIVQMNPGVNLYRYSFGESWMLYIILAIIGVFGVIFAGGIAKSKWLEWISKQLLFILATHFILLVAINAVLGKFALGNMKGVIATVICLIAEYIAVMVIKRIKFLDKFSRLIGII